MRTVTPLAVTRRAGAASPVEVVLLEFGAELAAELAVELAAELAALWGVADPLVLVYPGFVYPESLFPVSGVELR